MPVDVYLMLGRPLESAENILKVIRISPPSSSALLLSDISSDNSSDELSLRSPLKTDELRFTVFFASSVSSYNIRTEPFVNL